MKWWFPRFLLGLGLFLSLEGWAATSIQVQSPRPNHPELTWLRRFLQLQGYQLSSSTTLILRVHPGSSVTVRKGLFSRTYTLPAGLQSPQLRARMVLMYLGLFQQEEKRRQKTPAPRKSDSPPPPPAPRPRKKVVVARPAKPKIRRRVQKKQARRTRRVVRRKQVVRSVRRIPRSKVVAQVRRDVKKNSRKGIATPPLMVVATPPARRVSPRPRPSVMATPRKKSIPRRLPPVRVRRVKARRVALAVVQVRTQPPVLSARPKQRKTLDFDLAVSLGLRWFSPQRLSGGLQLQAGLNVLRWTFRAEAALHWFRLDHQNRDILLLRPGFWMGWRFPLGVLERWVELVGLTGLTSEVFVEEESDSYTSSLHWGWLLGFQLHGKLSKRWSLWLRPALKVYPSGIGVDGTKGTSLTPLQVSLLMGAQVRF